MLLNFSALNIYISDGNICINTDTNVSSSKYVQKGCKRFCSLKL